jgi:hypothetical protein
VAGRYAALDILLHRGSVARWFTPGVREPPGVFFPGAYALRFLRAASSGFLRVESSM